MTIDPSLPVLLAQLGHTERLAHDAQTQPELARSTAQEVAKEALLHDREQVQKTDNAEHSPGVQTRQEQGMRFSDAARIRTGRTGVARPYATAPGNQPKILSIFCFMVSAVNGLTM